MFGQLSVGLGHAGRHIEQKEHGGAQGGLPPARELTKAQILIDEPLVGRVRRAALDRLLEGTAPIQARACTAPVPALALPFGLIRLPGARLQIGQLQFFPHPIDDVVDFEFQQEFGTAAFGAAGTFVARFVAGIGLAQKVAGFGGTLTHALCVGVGSKLEPVVFQHAYRNAHGAGAIADNVGTRDDLR